MPTLLDNESDGQLARRFAEGRDERAFAKLVERRGPLVQGVCTRLLRRREDAEDAFQAVFLVLARRARSLRRAPSLAGWLHGVAVRVCLNQRKTDRRRQQRMQEVADVAREESKPDRLEELKLVIDEELAALPQRYREVLVLCDVEGSARNEVSRMLGLPTGTVSSRLSRGRELIRKRLARRGVSVAAGGVALALAKCSEAAPAVSAELVGTVVQNAQTFIWGTGAAQATLSIKITSLAKGVLYAMAVTRWKTTSCIFALVGTFLFGGALAPSFVPELSNAATAGTLFLDDFEDGSATDGSPVTWVAPPYAASGTRIVENGSLVITAQVPNLSHDTDVQGQEYGDVSIRTLFRATAEDVVGLYVRSTLSGPLGNPNQGQQLYSYITGNGTMEIGRLVKGQLQPLRSVLVGWDPTGVETHLELSVIDNRASVFAWLDGTAKPAAPQLDVDLSGASDLVVEGRVGIWTFAFPSPTPSGSVAFREVEVVPEPTSGMLATATCALLIGGMFFGRRRFARRTSGLPS